MTDTDKKLLIRFEADNKGLLRKLEQSQKKINSFEAAAGKDIGSVTRRFQSLGGAPTNSVKKFGNAANDSFAGVRRGVGQLGFQVQDVAVQLQGGQNPLLILSQQGSQVASIFGPGGAVIGAFVAVGAVVASVMAPEIADAAKKFIDLETQAVKLQKGLEALNERVSINSNGTLEYTKRIQDLAKVSKQAAEVELSIALIQAEANIQTATDGIVKSVGKIERQFERIEGAQGGAKRGIEKRLERLRDEFGLTEAQAESFRSASQRLLADPTIANAAAFNDLAAGLDLGNEKLRTFISDLNTNIQSLNNSKAAVDALKGVLVDFDIDPPEFDSSSEKRISSERESALKSFEALRSSLLSEEAAIRESYSNRNQIIDDALAKEAITKKQANMLGEALLIERNNAFAALDEARVTDTKNFISQSLSAIQSGLDKESALAKVAFAAQQAIAMAEMVVATESAATKALTLGPIAGPIASGAIRALGYSAVGVVAGQTIASFEGGGMTPNGPRSGGMDGKGGMLAMLHPNEKITDLTKSSANDGEWKVEINNYAGAQISQNIDEEKRIISVMVEQVNNTNSRVGLALQTKYQGMQAKGTR